MTVETAQTTKMDSNSNDSLDSQQQQNTNQDLTVVPDDHVEMDQVLANSGSVSLEELPELLKNGPHPLQNEWTLWYFGQQKRSTLKSWAENLKEVVTFGTVEDFWGYAHGCCF